MKSWKKEFEHREEKKQDAPRKPRREQEHRDSGVENMQAAAPSGPPAGTNAAPSEAAEKGQAAASPSVSMPPVLSRLRKSLDDIWINIILEASDKPNTLMICGSTHREGCTFTAFHLSLFLTLEYHMKVLYVDMSSAASHEHAFLPGIRNRPGLASYFMENRPLSELVLRSQYHDLFVLPSGTCQTRGGLKQNVIFNKNAVTNLMSFCRTGFDITIFDSQPITFSPTMIEFAKAVDQVALVCRYGYSRRELSMLVIDKLRKKNVPVVGMILNDRQYPIPARIFDLLK